MKRLVLLAVTGILMIPVGVLAQSLEGIRDRTAHPPIHVHGAATSAPTGFSPADMQNYYAFTGLYNPSSATGAPVTGTGQVIAIVDAYDDPTIASDLQQFSAHWGLQTMKTGGCTVGTGSNPPCFQKVYAQRKPPSNGGWALEIALDVEWAHAIAPGADILLVEARSSSLSDLLGAVTVAKGYAAVHVVTMSWGAGEFSSESLYDSYFNKTGVMFVASSGDSGSPLWPGASPNVVGAGGTMQTQLVTNGTCVMSSGRECAWNDQYLGYTYSSGGGLSSYEPQPSYQSGFGISSSGRRGIPDVAYYADINPGVAVYDTTSDNGQTGWFAVGGTSAASPQWAALFALADQLRSRFGLAPLPGGYQSPYPLYSVAHASYGATFNDVRQGCNTTGACAASGYDLVTGIGSPIAFNLVVDLSSSSVP